MDNPIADIIRDYSAVYNNHVAKFTTIENTVDGYDNLYSNVFFPHLSQEDVERIDQIFVNAEELLDELVSILDKYSDVFDDFNELNDAYNEAIKVSIDVSELKDDYITLSEELSVYNEKVNALFTAMESYTAIMDSTIGTLKEKFPDVYAEYEKSLETPVAEETAETVETVEDAENLEAANEVFDKIQEQKPEAMFVENAIDAAFSEAMKEPTVLTNAELLAYSEAIVKCQSMKDDMYNRYKGMVEKFGGSDILNENLAAVNNVLKECDNLIKIFSLAVNEPNCWNNVNMAQSSVYRYEALQNDMKVIGEALDVVQQRLTDGSARRAGAGRNVRVDLNYEDIEEYRELMGLIGGLQNEIEDYFCNPLCNEVMRAWIVSRFDDILFHAENYKKTLASVSAITDVHGGGWPLGIYGQEGMYGSLLGNELRECNLIASEIRNVISAPRKHF